MYFASTTCAAAPVSLLVAHSAYGAVDGDAVTPVARPYTLADYASAQDFLEVLKAARARYVGPDETDDDIDDEIRETYRELARIRASFRRACA